MIVGHIYWWFSRMPKKDDPNSAPSNAITNGPSVKITKDLPDEYEWDEDCTCFENEYPPWTAEVHVSFFGEKLHLILWSLGTITSANEQIAAFENFLVACFVGLHKLWYCDNDFGCKR